MTSFDEMKKVQSFPRILRDFWRKHRPQLWVDVQINQRASVFCSTETEGFFSSFFLGFLHQCQVTKVEATCFEKEETQSTHPLAFSVDSSVSSFNMMKPEFFANINFNFKGLRKHAVVWMSTLRGGLHSITILSLALSSKMPVSSDNHQQTIKTILHLTAANKTR